VKAERPTRVEGAFAGDRGYTEEHPAFATIGASRVSSGGAGQGATLFNSDFRHNHYMTITIRKADLRRDLSNDWVHGSKEYIEVALSESQWATFVATPNVGTGVPCTLTYRAPGGDGPVPQIAPPESRREQFRSELDQRLAEALQLVQELHDAAPSKKLRDKAYMAMMKIRDGVPWVEDQFDEHTEKTVEKAKTEIASYIEGVIARAGIKTLGGEAPPMLALNDGGEPTVE
jgi:hypothetical protein